MSSSPQVKTFVPNTPVEFSAGLISALDSSNETSFSRQQKKEQYIQNEISKKLNSIQHEKANVLNDKLKSLISDSDDKSSLLGSNELNEKLNTINENMKSLASFQPQKSKELQAAESEVTKCLLNNKSQPLNCWDHVQAFKKLAADF